MVSKYETEGVQRSGVSWGCCIERGKVRRLSLELRARRHQRRFQAGGRARVGEGVMGEIQGS